MSRVDLIVPDLGNFNDVAVVDVLVKPGDAVEIDSPLVTLETDKASMDVPATAAGTIAEVLLKRGDKVSKGSVIARLDTNSAAGNRVGASSGGASAAAPGQGGAETENSDEEYAASFDADELARTITQPAIGVFAPPGAEAANSPAANGAGQPPARAESAAHRDARSATGQQGAAPAGARPGAQPGVAPAQPGVAPAGAAQSGVASSASSSSSPAARAPVAPPAGRSDSSGDTVRMPIPDFTGAGRAEVEFNRSTQLLVLGAGPGGYTAAFRAADLGLQVTLVERWPDLGGVCLNVGCIPSKALLHAAKVIEEAEEMGEHGIAFGAPAIDLEALRGWKTSVVKKLTGGLRMLAKQRKVEVVQGTGRFVSPNVVEVMGNSGSQRIRFDQCIIAAGSEAIRLPGLPSDPRIMDSTDALELPEFSGGLLVVGGGIIGLEMACVYDALGSRVSVVELTPQLMPGCDPDLVRPLERRIRPRYEQILLGTKVAKVEALSEGLRVTFEGEKAPGP